MLVNVAASAPLLPGPGPPPPAAPPATSSPDMAWEAPTKFRPAGAPAGAWPHTPWYVCTFYDPYERVNVWSHGLPALALVLLGVLAKAGVVPGGMALTVYCFCGAVVHTSSAITHVWPDDHVLEKIDHICIPFLIIGTPLTAIMAQRPEGPYKVFAGAAVGLLAAAFLRPLPRVIAFVTLGAVLFLNYFWVINANLATQIVLHLLGAYSFIRNGGHNRPVGFQDHHILHYCVTSATAMHVWYILSASVRPKLA